MSVNTPLPQANIRRLDAGSVETWLFDLDNTLYPARCNLFMQVSARMTEFIQSHFKLDHEPARELQRDLENGKGIVVVLAKDETNRDSNLIVVQKQRKTQNETVSSQLT